MTMEMATLLKEDLKRFGLNPEDWILRPTAARDELLIEHRRDADFLLLGRRRGLNWADLQLIGL